MAESPLHGVRIHLSGAVPDETSTQQREAMLAFVETFAFEVMRRGGTLIHGSHPTLTGALLSAARRHQEASDRPLEGGKRDVLILARAHRYAGEEYRDEIAEHNKWAVVEIIPSSPGAPGISLVPMREWMAERCDVVVAMGGRRDGANPENAGVPAELAEMLKRGKPGFVLPQFGGAIAYLMERCELWLSRLRNGWTEDENRKIWDILDPNELTERILSQIRLLPLYRGSVESGRMFRILALDGGGIRGVFTAAVLAKWAEMLGDNGGNDLVKHFDLVAGTSTGGILAIGLGLGMPPQEMLKFYRESGPAIFTEKILKEQWMQSTEKPGIWKRIGNKLSWPVQSAKNLAKSKYDSDVLRSALEKAFEAQRLMSSSLCRLVIPTVRAYHGEAEIITTAHSPDRCGFRDITAVDAALASSAAPTFFDTARVKTQIAGQTYLDGGIWANNPVLPAIVEAIRYLGVPLERIDVLSVGTLANKHDFSSALDGGKANWGIPITKLFFSAQETAASTLTNGLLGLPRHLRVNENTISPIGLDDVGAIEYMATRGENVGHDSFSLVQSRFLNGSFVTPWPHF